MGPFQTAAAQMVPKAFREFLPFVSPSGLRVVHKEKVLGLALEIVGRTANQKRYEEEKARVIDALKSSGLDIDVGASNPETAWTGVPPEDRKAAGEALLTLYFHLVFAPGPFFLDLRPAHFGWDPGRKRLLWEPSRLFHLPTDDFRSRATDLYRGFFGRDANATKRGIALYQWESEPAPGFEGRMESLMRAHFGDAESQEVLFSMTHFRETFHLIFEEAIQSRSRFHPELTFLGTALAGLYLSLEKIAVPLDVVHSYRRVVAGLEKS